MSWPAGGGGRPQHGGMDLSNLSATTKIPALPCVRSQDSKAPSQRQPRCNLLMLRLDPPVTPDMRSLGAISRGLAAFRAVAVSGA
jgi:hypothetical protein